MNNINTKNAAFNRGNGTQHTVLLWLCKACLCPTMGLVLMLVCGSLLGQPADTVRNPALAEEFFRVNSAFSRLRQTELTMQYRYSVSNRIGVVVDSSQATFLVHEGMMSGEMEGVRLVRNRHYSLTISPEDSLIAIGALVEGAGALQLNLFDSMFRAVNIAGFDKIELPNDKKKLLVHFKPNTYYKQYAITYNKDYRIEQVVLECLNTAFDDDGQPPPLGSTRTMEVRYQAYRSANFDLNIFDEAQYIKRDEYGQWVGNGDYKGWQVMATQPNL